MTTGRTGRPTRPDTAGMVTRALAFIVDALLLASGVTGLLLLVGLIGAVLGWGQPGLVRGLAVALATAVPSVWLGLNAVMWATAGRTPGKALLGLRVVRTDGTPVHLLRAAIRALGYPVSGLLLAGFLWVLVDRNRQAWHDRLAGTLVVYDRWPAATSSAAGEASRAGLRHPPDQGS